MVGKISGAPFRKSLLFLGKAPILKTSCWPLIYFTHRGWTMMMVKLKRISQHFHTMMWPLSPCLGCFCSTDWFLVPSQDDSFSSYNYHTCSVCRPYNPKYRESFIRWRRKNVPSLQADLVDAYHTTSDTENILKLLKYFYK